MDILRYESEGIEFFTVQATGESGISYSGLAILCGVNQSTITRLITKLADLTSCSEKNKKGIEISNGNGFNPMRDKGIKRLKAFIDKDLHLEGAYKKKGGVVKILRANFCAAVIKHYALEGREIAEHSMDKFMTLGINTWIQSITGWQIHSIPASVTDTSEASFPTAINLQTDIDCEKLIQQIDLLHHDLMVALKHRHAIHNIVEKPTVVDLSLNQIVHTAVHVQADKLNQALITLQSIRENIKALTTINQKLAQYNDLWQSFNQITNLLAEFRQENTYLKQVIEQQKILFSPRRKAQSQLSTHNHLQITLKPRIQEIAAILMKSQIRKGGSRANNTCTKKATIYALYEIGQSLDEIARVLHMPYETVKTYVKLTRADLRDYYSEQN